MKNILSIGVLILTLLSNQNQLLAQNSILNQLSLDHIVIRGSSNLNDFVLEFVTDSKQHKVLLESSNLESIEFNIPVIGITSSNRYILNDFKNLINASEYPFIKLTVDQKVLKSIFDGKNRKCVNVEVNIAGKTKMYEIPFSVSSLTDSQNFMLGKANILLSDFGLKPISKIFGLVKVENEVNIDFRINFEGSDKLKFSNLEI